MNSGAVSGIPFPPDDSKLLTLSGILPKSGSTTLTLPSGSNYLFLTDTTDISTDTSANKVTSVAIDNFSFCISPNSALLGSMNSFTDITKEVHFLSNSSGSYYNIYWSTGAPAYKCYYLITGGTTLTIYGDVYFSAGIAFKIYFYKYN